MKQYRSQFLKAVSLTYLSFPVSFLILAAVFFDIPASRCVTILLSPFYYLVSLVAIFAGWGLWEMKRWNWHVFLGANFIILYECAYLVAIYGETHHKVLSFLFWAVVLGVLIYRVRKELRVPYFLPNIRWWESNARYHLEVPVEVTGSGALLRGKILDISVRGCFIQLPDAIEEESEVSLSFRVFGQPIGTTGQVVWKTESTVTHPKGIGVKFDTMDRPLRRRLRIAIKRLNRISSLYRRPKDLNQEEVSRILKELEAGSRP